MKKINALRRTELLAQLQARLSVERSRLLMRRIRAVILALEGMPLSAVAKEMRSAEKSISAWLDLTVERGVDALAPLRLKGRLQGVMDADVTRDRQAIANVLSGKLNERERRRLLAVDSILSGASHSSAAQLHHLKPTAVSNAMKLFRSGGLAALRYKRQGRRPRASAT